MMPTIASLQGRRTRVDVIYRFFIRRLLLVDVMRGHGLALDRCWIREPSARPFSGSRLSLRVHIPLYFILIPIDHIPVGKHGLVAGRESHRSSTRWPFRLLFVEALRLLPGLHGGARLPSGFDVVALLRQRPLELQFFDGRRVYFRGGAARYQTL